MNKKSITLIFVSWGLVALMTAALTYLVTDRQKFPYTLVKSVEKKLVSLVKGQSRDEKAAGPTQKEISSVFLRLQLETIDVEMPGVSRGGGMTSFGDELLLINQIGDIYIVTDTGITKTNVSPPDNGLQRYASLDGNPSYSEYKINPDVIRYNDIQYYKNDMKQALVVSYTDWNHEDECYSSAVAELTLPIAQSSLSEARFSSSDWKLIYKTQPCLPMKKMITAIEGHMAGGRIAYRAPSTIYLASGEYHWDGLYGPKILSQAWENDYGKVLEIDLLTGDARRLTRGHRNMQGILFDESAQDVWVVEHGPRGGDELNRVVEGENYGWPVQTLGTRYNYLPWPNTINYGRHDLPEFKEPVYSYVPSVGISNVIQVLDFHSSWDGDFLASSLSGKSLFRMRMRDNRVLFSERIRINKRIRYVHQHTDGRIVMLTDEMNIVFLSQAANDLSVSFIEKIMNKKIDDASLRGKVSGAITACMECHSFNGVDIAAGPPLGRIFGQEVASLKAFDAYSNALKSKTQKWDEQELLEFLLRTEEYAPGTSMPNPNLKPEVAMEIINVMRQLATDLEQGN